MYILGVNCYLHDSSAALIEDGKLIAFADEERFNRRKHSGDFPAYSIRYCLDEAGIEITDLDYIGFYWDPRIGLIQRALYLLKHPIKSFFGAPRYSKNRGELSGWWNMMNVKNDFEKHFSFKFQNNRKPFFNYIEHHPAHIAGTYYVSGYDDAACLSIDASGEWVTTMKAHAAGDDFKIIETITNPDSVGNLYAAITEYLGFKISCDEGKVMGLSSYGEDKYKKEFQDFISLEPDGKFKINLKYFNFLYLRQRYLFSDLLVKRLGKNRLKKEKITKRYEDIAASLQRRTEEVGLHLAEDLYKKTKSKNICLSGGVALNSVMNGEILLKGPYDNAFILPAAADPGAALGAAYYIYHKILKKPRNFILKHAYYGPGFNDDEYKKAFTAANLKYEYYENIEEITAKYIEKGYIIGWFQGRMEFGPRALGNRSIVVDPRDNKMKDTLNARVKHREAFRPFAPSALEEKAEEIFVTKGYNSPYMLLVFDVREDKRDLVPAITHVDGTGRLQTVNKETNPKYWNLINEFYKLTGVPLVLNTSFNIMGEPIVCTPTDAVNSFSGTGIDILVMGNFISYKPDVKKIDS